MIRINHPNDIARTRRLSLSSQGLLKTAPFGSGLAGARKAIQHIGYLQLDTISVVERAHHHVLYSRVPNFKPNHLDKLLLNKDIFEYWSHAAAFLPIEDYRYSLPYKQAIKSGTVHWFKNPDKKLMRELIARIRTDGPIRSRDLENNAKKGVGWWDWKPAKKALEQLYMQGDLMVKDRQGFQKSYDLTERVLPSSINTTMPTIDEFAGHLIEQQLRCHGLVSIKGFTYLRRNSELRKAVKRIIDNQLEDNQLQLLRLINGEIFVVDSKAFEKRLARISNRVAILSPFDNFAIQRDRLSSLFDFNYQIECYVPRHKRRYGYFCLPLLFRDNLVGRMDCKAHRQSKTFEIISLYLEDDNLNIELFSTAFKNAIIRFMKFQKCRNITVTRVIPKKLEPRIKRLLLDLK